MEEFQYRDLCYMNVVLPEDINKRKWHGDFEGAIRLIDLWLTKDIPYALKAKLKLEKHILMILPHEYTLTYKEAFTMAKESIHNLNREEFADLMDQGKIDWLYVDGQEHFFRRFLSTLLKVNPELKKRAIAQRQESSNLDELELEALHTNIQKIKQSGTYGCRFTVRAAVKPDKNAFCKGKVLVHIPIPSACKQVSNIKILETSSSHYQIAPEDASQRTICFEENLSENQEFFVRYQYDYHIEYVNPKEALATDELPDGLEKELEEQSPHICFTPYLRALAEEITKGVENPLAKARAIYDYITTHITYSFMREYITVENITEYAALGQKGDCGVQTLLFITLCRICKIPAQWESGLYVTPYSAGSHDWAKFYCAPYGWLFADCSFGGAAHREQDEERREFYFGNVDTFRMPANHRFQEQFTVPKKYLRADPYDSQRGEVEYEDHGLYYDEFEAIREVEQIEFLQ